MKKTGINILGTGSYAPDNIATNDDYAKFVDTSDEWIKSRTGMSQRHISKDEPVWYMSAQAGKRALGKAGLEPSDIDMIIASTVSGDYAFPSLASCVQNALDIPCAIAIDVNVACTGIASTLDMARLYLADGQAKRILVVGGEALSQLTDYTDRSTCVLFGDAAGAIIVEAADKFFTSYQNCNAKGGKHLYYKRIRTKNPFNTLDTSKYSLFGVEEKEGGAVMNGGEVYKFAVKAMPEAIIKACEKAGISVEDIDLVIAHQANGRIIETAAKNMNLPAEKVYINIDRYGNTSSATMPVCLDECIENNKLKRGDKVCFVGFGAGLTYGATIIEY